MALLDTPPEKSALGATWVGGARLYLFKKQIFTYVAFQHSQILKCQQSFKILIFSKSAEKSVGKYFMVAYGTRMQLQSIAWDLTFACDALKAGKLASRGVGGE